MKRYRDPPSLKTRTFIVDESLRLLDAPCFSNPIVLLLFSFSYRLSSLPYGGFCNELVRLTVGQDP